MPSVITTDSLTYTFISNDGQTLFSNNYPLPLVNISFLIVGDNNGTGSPYFQGISITKVMDINTSGFLKSLFSHDTNMENENIVIEIKVYKKRDSTPYFSYKLTNIKIGDYSLGSETNSIGQYEYISLFSKIYGYKDYVTNKSIGFNVSQNRIVPY